tara:strand:- start:9428 stop:9745 length:318 start_codon:yes stop_codon:yes gene_type:complete
MKPTVKQFKEYVEEQSDLEIRWYGKYHGRSCHEGIAVTGFLGDGGALVERMKNDGLRLGRWNHQDNLGYDHIMSWNVGRLRSEEESEQPKSKREVWMDAVKDVRV